MNATPVLEKALATGKATNPPGHSHDHGELHWKSVALIGLHLARYTPHADLEFLLTFATLHDLCRENEYEDPEHGQRAATLFIELTIHPGLQHFPPYDQRTLDMVTALRDHCTETNARGHDNVNVGLCWDADRLHLYRVGKEPERIYLTTKAAHMSSSWLLGLGLARKMALGEEFPSWADIGQEMQQWRFP